MFALVDAKGRTITKSENFGGEEMGLLLYKGGTVCDDYFDNLAANAICRQMGFKSATRWTNEKSYKTQQDYEIKLTKVVCEDSEWESCSYSEEPNCQHNEDVFLSCSSTGKYNY